MAKVTMKAVRDFRGIGLPVVAPCVSSEIYVTTGTKALTAPTNAGMVQVEALAGTAYLRKASSGSLPGTWPPAADDATAEEWYRIEAATQGEIREFGVVEGDEFRLEVQAGAQVQVFWY